VETERISEDVRGAGGLPAVAADPDALVRTYVRPGDHLHLAMTLGRPNALTYALARSFGRSAAFTVSVAAVHSAAHALALSGSVRHMITCFLGDTYPSPRPNPIYRKLARGEPFTAELWSLLSHTQRLVAGAMGLPFTVTTSLAGSDLAEGKEGALFTVPGPPGASGPVTLASALRPDLTLVHGVCADRRGNIVLVPPIGEGAWAAYAARRGVLASVERIVPEWVIERHPERVVIPGQRVIALCEAPYGAHPQSLRGADIGGVTGYRDDYAFLTEVAERCATPEGAREWFREWVLDVEDHAGYLERLGEARFAELALRETGEDCDPALHGAPSTFTYESAVGRGVGSAATAGGAASAAAASAASGKADPPPRPTDQQRLIILGARAVVERVLAGPYDTLLAGIGASHLAAWLAARWLRRRGRTVHVCAELGFYGMTPEPGDVFLFSQLHAARSQSLGGVAETLGGMVAGNAGRCLGVLAAGEIDRDGNINTSLLADGRWLTGSGGANDIASHVDCVVVAAAGRRRYVDRVAYVTSPGHRVLDVVSQFGRFSRPAAGTPFHLATFLPPAPDGADESRVPATAEEAVATLTDWSADTAGAVIEKPITSEELAALRRLDPTGVYR